MPNRPVMGTVPVLAMAAALAACGPASAPPDGATADAVLAARVATDAPSLVLDLTRRRLELIHGDALLRSFEVLEAEYGYARWAALRGGGGAPPVGPWTPARLSPRRRSEVRVIRPDTAGAPDPSGSIDWVPPRPEELNPDPARMRIAYVEGLTLDLRADDAPAPRWQLHPMGDVVVRVRLERTDLGTLFRGLPDSVPLVVITP